LLCAATLLPSKQRQLQVLQRVLQQQSRSQLQLAQALLVPGVQASAAPIQHLTTPPPAQLPQSMAAGTCKLVRWQSPAGRQSLPGGKLSLQQLVERQVESSK